MITKVRSPQQFIRSIARGKRGLSPFPPWNKYKLKMKLGKSFWSTHIINSLCNPIVRNLYSYTDTYHHLPIFRRKKTWCRNACRFTATTRPSSVCLQSSWLGSLCAEMSAVRSSVEWLFGDVINSFKFNDFKKDLKLFLSSFGKIYVVSVILRNAMTCLDGNMTSEFFYLRPPTLDTYFG